MCAPLLWSTPVITATAIRAGTYGLSRCQPDARVDQGMSRTTPSRALVLIVEDFEDAREMYADYFEFNGLTVVCAADGAEGVRVAIERLPDLIVMDAGLPKLTGWEATAMLRTHPDTDEIPILMLTGHVFHDSSDRAREAGVDVFVTKPCLPDQLYAHVLELLRRGRTTPPAMRGINAAGAPLSNAGRRGAAPTQSGRKAGPPRRRRGRSA